MLIGSIYLIFRQKSIRESNTKLAKKNIVVKTLMQKKFAALQVETNDLMRRRPR
jgi:hypothetical protein